MLQNRSTERDASSGNVFRDLGFSAAESERLVVRADLLLQNQKALTARRLAKAQAAKLLQVTQARITDLLLGADRLADVMCPNGLEPRLDVPAADTGDAGLLR
jgi:predicted XRE-type DNA-binding protein